MAKGYNANTVVEAMLVAGHVESATQSFRRAYEQWDAKGRKKESYNRFDSLELALSGVAPSPFITPYMELMDAADSLYTARQRYDSLPEELREHSSMAGLRLQFQEQAKRLDELLKSKELAFSPI